MFVACAMFSFLFLCFIIINFFIFLDVSEFVFMRYQNASQLHHISFRRILSIHLPTCWIAVTITKEEKNTNEENIIRRKTTDKEKNTNEQAN